MLKFEVFDCCESTNPKGYLCQLEAGHSGDHCTTGYQYQGVDTDDEPVVDMYPIYWSQPRDTA